MTIAEKYPHTRTPTYETDPDPYQPGDDQFGYQLVDPWAVLRFRWKDQLRIIVPNVWAVIEAELAPVEARYRAMADTLDDARSIASNEITQSKIQRSQLEARASEARSGFVAQKDRADLESRARASAVVNAQALARALVDLANRTLPGENWESLLGDDSVKLVKHYGADGVVPTEVKG